MIEFEVLAMKAETNNLYAIFLLKKNVWTDIIKTILGYPPMVAPEMLREWKVAIISIGQGYEFTESRQDYRTRTKMTYRGRGTLINIGKAKDNFNKDRKPKCFNYNVYECYELKSLKLDKRTNSCIRVNIRELDRKLFTKWSILYTSTDGLC